MLQWIYELLMSKQDKQVVVQIMQLWLAKPKAFKVVDVQKGFSREYPAIKSSEFSVEYNLSNGECQFGELRLQTGWFAKKMLRMFATQQALLCFHENAANKLLEEETPVKEKPLTANENREQENAYDAYAMNGHDVLPQSVVIKKLYKEKQPTALKPPFTRQQLEDMDGKNVSVLLDGREWHKGVFVRKTTYSFSFKDTLFFVGGMASPYSGKLGGRKIVCIRIDGASTDSDSSLNKDSAKEQPTTVVLKPPFTEEQIKSISGKKVVVKLRDGSVRTNSIYHRDRLDYPIGFLGEGYTLKGEYLKGGFLCRDGRDIMEIKLEENV